MNHYNIINVVGDLENFVDTLLSHLKEDRCSHSVIYLIDELLNMKNARGATPRLKFKGQIQQSTEMTGGSLLNEYTD